MEAWDRSAPEPAFARPNVAGLSRQELKELVASLGEPVFRANQVFEGLYRQRWDSWDRFTNLSKELRDRLQKAIGFIWPQIIESRASSDGSTKHVLRLSDGRSIEAVHMPYEDRATLCLSSQVGCALGCTFCATGQMGLVRNLSAAEIVGQVVTLLNAHTHPQSEPVNLVFMGMGEPLHNLEHVMEAFTILTDPKGLAIPPRRITLSTAGLVTGIQRLGGYAKRPRLALSLNATTDDARLRIMPVNRAWGLDALMDALRAFPLNHNERITVEYILLKDINDSREDGRRLAAFANRFPSKVNLIPFNPYEGGAETDGFTAQSTEGGHAGNRFAAPDEARIDELCQVLVDAGIPVSVRRSRGQDVAGACGQLVRGQERGSST